MVLGVLSIGMIFLCKYFAEDAQAKGNVYTLNHLKYNLLFFQLQILEDLALIIFCLLRMEPAIRNGCCSKFISGFYIIMRVILLVAVIWIFLFTTGFDFLAMTWTLNRDNWWASKDEKFITNDSYFNAALCWVLWSVFISIEWMLILLISIHLMSLVV